MAESDQIGNLLRAETHRRLWPGVKVHEGMNSLVTVEVGDGVVEMSGKIAQDLWQWLKQQPDDLPVDDFLARARALAG